VKIMAFKPGKKGTITAPFDAGDIIGIDGKTYQVVPERVAMVQKMELKIGDKVEYKQLGQGPDKGKINFIAPDTDPAAAPKGEETAAPKADAPPRKEPVTLVGVYISHTGSTITVKVGEKYRVLTAELDVLKIVSVATNPKVKPGDNVTVQLVDDGKGNMVAHKIGPGALGEQFKTGKQLLEDNLNSMNDEAKKRHDAETVDADKAMQDNKEMAEKMAAEHAKAVAQCERCQHLSDMADGTRTCSGNDPIFDPNCQHFKGKVAAATGEAAKKIVTQMVQEILEAPPGGATGGVEIGIHINLGNYSSFDLKVTGVNGDHARQLLKQESSPTIALVKGIIKDASKGY
jgi:hypothetical protein